MRRFHDRLYNYLNQSQKATVEEAVLKLTKGWSKTSQRKLIDKILFTELWTNDGTVRAGLAHALKGFMELHPELMRARADRPERLLEHDETLFHEIGHLMSYWILQGRGHGRDWRLAMKALGRSYSERCHDLKYVKPLNGLTKKHWRCEPCNVTYGHGYRRSYYTPKTCHKCKGPVTVKVA